MRDRRPLLAIAFLAASVLLYVLCLPQGAICIGGSCRGWSGFFIATLGWLELVGIGRASFLVVTAWYANPAVWVAWGLLLGRAYLGAAAAGLVAVLLALGYRLGSRILVSESGEADLISGVGPGYWEWVVSMGFACVAGLIGWIQTTEAPVPAAGRR